MKPALTVLYIVFLATLIIVKAQRLNPRKAKINKIVSTTIPMYRRQEERLKLPLYPKNTMRFVVTPKPFESKNEEPKVKLQTKKPLMKKIILKKRSEDIIDKIPVTRRPVMKAIDSIIEPIKPKNNANNNHVEKKREISYKYSQNNDFVIDEAYAEEVIEMYDEQDFPEEDYPRLSFEPRMESNRLKRKTQMSNKIKLPDYSHPVEEVDDPSEFIFFKKFEFKVQEDDLKEAPAYVTQGSETTTELLESKWRPKRHVNIIEEENQATTRISGFIYTDRDSKLSNELLFKNINA